MSNEVQKEGCNVHISSLTLSPVFFVAFFSSAFPRSRYLAPRRAATLSLRFFSSFPGLAPPAAAAMLALAAYAANPLVYTAASSVRPPPARRCGDCNKLAARNGSGGAAISMPRVGALDSGW